IKASLAFAQTSGTRLPLGPAAEVADQIIARLGRVKGVKEITGAGSLRRGRDTIGDVDLLAQVKEPSGCALMEAFCSMPEVVQVLVRGDTKSSVRFRLAPESARWARTLGDGQAAEGGPAIQVDLRVIPPENWGAALLYFTGSKQHNIRLRDRAIKKGFT